MLEQLNRTWMAWDDWLARARWWPWVLAVVLLISVAMRVSIGLEAKHPGHADYAFYYTVAENLVDGRGLVVDYIWHYLSDNPRLPNPSNDYWQPGASVIMASFLALFGRTQFVALLPAMLASLLLAVPVYLWAKDYARSTWVAGCAAALVWFIPRLFDYALLTDSTIYYVFLLAWAFWLMGRGWRDPRYFLGAAACVALAHTVRQDSVLTLGVLTIAMLLSPHPWKTKLGWGVVALVVYLLVLSPLLAVNLATLGEPLPSGPQRTTYLTTYEDLYASHRELTPQAYLRWGWDNIWRNKREMASLISQQVRDFWPSWMWWLLVGAALYAWFAPPDRQPNASVAVWPLVSMLAIVAFYALVATFPGRYAVNRSGMLILPYLLVIAVDFLHRVLPYKWMFLVAVLVMAVTFGGAALERGYGVVRGNNWVGERLRTLDLMVKGDALKQGLDESQIVIMTRNPWEVYHATRYAAIAVPNETVDRVFQVAQRYGATYLILPGNRPALERYLAENHLADPRFKRVGTLPHDDRSTLYRINLEVGR